MLTPTRNPGELSLTGIKAWENEPEKGAAEWEGAADVLSISGKRGWKDS